MLNSQNGGSKERDAGAAANAPEELDGPGIGLDLPDAQQEDHRDDGRACTVVGALLKNHRI